MSLVVDRAIADMFEENQRQRFLARRTAARKRGMTPAARSRTSIDHNEGSGRSVPSSTPTAAGRRRRGDTGVRLPADAARPMPKLFAIGITLFGIAVFTAFLVALIVVRWVMGMIFGKEI